MNSLWGLAEGCILGSLTAERDRGRLVIQDPRLTRFARPGASQGRQDVRCATSRAGWRSWRAKRSWAHLHLICDVIPTKQAGVCGRHVKRRNSSVLSWQIA